mmetsp:Transcript_37724/g.120995  ORF Transcript_37724/g.120995 Transcript_37724/m.120995 type:complete len:230 (-) Transcript_37724:81-770(-)
MSMHHCSALAPSVKRTSRGRGPQAQRSGGVRQQPPPSLDVRGPRVSKLRLEQPLFRCHPVLPSDRDGEGNGRDGHRYAQPFAASHVEHGGAGEVEVDAAVAGVDQVGVRPAAEERGWRRDLVREAVGEHSLGPLPQCPAGQADEQPSGAPCRGHLAVVTKGEAAPHHIRRGRCGGGQRLLSRREPPEAVHCRSDGVRAVHLVRKPRGRSANVEVGEEDEEERQQKSHFP